jgi:hypothetical protein
MWAVLAARSPWRPRIGMQTLLSDLAAEASLAAA